MTTQPKFRGWWILLWATIAAGATAPGQTIGVSSFVDHVIDDLGITRNALSAAYLFGTLLAATFAPWVGRKLDIHGVRRPTLIIAVSFVAAIAYMGTVRNLVMLAIGFTFIRLLGQGSLTLATSNVVSLWFYKRLGLANGVKGTASGLLLSLAPLLFTLAIDGFGWRWAWVAIAIGTGCILIPIALWGFVDRPSDIGQFPDGADAEPTTDHATGAARQRAHTVKEATSSPSFWVLIGISAVTGALSTGLVFQHVSIMEEAGLTETQAASVFLPMAVAIASTALVFGFLVDRVSTRVLLPLTMAFMAAAMLAAPLVNPGFSAWGYGALLGIVGGATQTVSLTVLPRWFGVDNQGALRGIAHVAGGGASAIGPLMLSLGQSTAGSYAPALRWYMLIPATVGLASIIVGAPKPLDDEQLIEDTEN